MSMTNQIRELLDEATELLATPPAQHDALYEADRAAFLRRRDEILAALELAERDWPGIDLTHGQAAGEACVVCSYEWADRDRQALPVGRAVHRGTVYACAGDCYDQIAAAAVSR